VYGREQSPYLPRPFVYPAAKVACIYFERLFVILRMGNFWVTLKFIFEKMRRMQPFDVFSPFP
jgi:hypothetical protein